MTELPQATSRRELRERERAALTPSKVVKPTARRSLGRRVLSAAAMLFVGALAVGLSIPAAAFSSTSSAQASASGAGAAASTGQTSAGRTAAGQTASVSGDETVESVTRDGFQVKSWAQLLAAQYAHIDNYKFSGGNGSIRWPFPVQVPISSPYGPRVAPCAGCSTFHNGVDFTPGAGAAIFAIADGVVTQREDGTGEYGNFVVITHQIGGHSVTSTYAHMQRASSPITLGETIKVGDFLGLVGMTGEATGPHLHFEIAVDGVRTDPIPWLEAHVN
jgi:murein DD-endopeptidase MepM/ murein hydrolase activator NlpD